MHSRILGPDGQPLMRRPAPSPEINAYLDVAYTSTQNAEHWGLTRPGDANVVFNYNVRRTSRQRSRYETANNAYLQGMVDTKTSDLIGDVSLQMLGGDTQQIEQAWNTWATEICLLEKLEGLYGTGKMIDGEGIALIVDNPYVDHMVKVDLINYESEQMGNPFGIADDFQLYDGVRHDNGFPIEYYLYDFHPEAYQRGNPAPYVGDWYSRERVIHTFRRYRNGQLRGATEMKAALDIAAIMRRYVLAEVSAAELAAEVSMILETDAPPEDPASQLSSQCQFMPWTRNMLYTTPYGWKMKQLKAEQPTKDSDKFVRSLVTMQGYSLGIPAVLSTGDSSEYNMASGRLDVQAYARRLESERARIFEPQCLEKVFAAFMRFYLFQTSGVSPISSDELRDLYPHRWAYRPINHSDPEKQAKADVAQYNAGHKTLFDVLYAQNKDPEQHFAELKEQNKRLAEVGMPVPGAMPGLEVGNQSEEQSDGNQQDSEAEEEGQEAETD